MWWEIIFRGRKKPERDLTALVTGLKSAVGSRLDSVLVYGSLASGEFHAQHSDVNVLVVLTDASFGVLRDMSPVMQKWIRRGHVMPVLVGRNELPDFAANFPIEFLDMMDHHRMCYGENPLADLKVDVRHLRSQCEHEVELNQLKLRQAIIIADGDVKKMRHVLTQSLPSILTLFRAALRLEGQPAKLGKMEAARELARRLGCDVSSLETLHAMRLEGTRVKLEETTQDYLKVIGFVLRQLRMRTS